MCKLILMVGLPRSGKTTAARQLGHPIVSPDAIRLAMHGQRYSTLEEPRVWEAARLMVRALFLAGHATVILDSTNGTRRRREQWRSAEWERAFHVLDTDVETCRQRARAMNDLQILPVIDRMASEWESPQPDELDAPDR
jgi:predicted kinase